MQSLRTILLWVVTAALLGGSVNAQSISLGVYAGTNIATASAEGTPSASSRSGLVVGAAFNLTLISPLAFRAEAQYVQKGGDFEYASSGGIPAVSTDYTLNYLEIPINLRIDLGSESMPLYVFAGTTVGTLLSATAHERSDDHDHEHDVKGEFNSVDLTFDVGGGAGFRLMEHIDLIADIRYSLGLTDIAKENEELLDVDSWKTRNIKLVAGVYFTL